MKTKLLGLMAGIFIAYPFSICQASSTDPYLWLEDVESARSLDWVAKQNQMSTQFLEGDPDYKAINADAKAIVLAKDEIPFSTFRDGYFYNFWQDPQHKHGLLRRTTLDEYRKQNPNWEILLDLDKLSADENRNWVFKGAQQLDEGSTRYLIQLSNGGKDAVVIREYDYQTRSFVTDGFNVPEGKTSVEPIDENEILIATSLTKDESTNAGYARFIRRWQRHQPLANAPIVFSIEKADAEGTASLFRDGANKHIVFSRMKDFFHVDKFVLELYGKLRQLPLPDTSTLLDVSDDFIYAQIKEPLKIGNTTLTADTVIRTPVSAHDLQSAEVVYKAGPRQTIESIDVRKSGVFVTILNNVRNQVLRFNRSAQGEWQSTILPFPNTGVADFTPRNDRDPKSVALLTYYDFLTPRTQYLVHDEDQSFRIEALKSAPARFDASGFEVKQSMARSADGTMIPYFLIQKKGLKLDGTNPTLLYGYGGFEISMKPTYSGIVGKAWLERGGVYVVANIRGGGEFGPEWHQAALKHNRQKAYDDFIAVAEDLIQTRVTSPAHLGIKGGSNGGLLVGAVMVQRPDLFKAVLCEVPLLDMERFSLLLAGASWIGEYGDPADPSDLMYLLRYSPYHNLRADRKYPTPLLMTSTKDDRVHPGHARKFAARMAEQGHPHYFYENVNGGHAGAGNLEEKARMTTFEYTYLWSQLR